MEKNIDFSGAGELVDVTTEWQEAQWKEYAEFLTQDGINSAGEIDVIEHALRDLVEESGLQVAFGAEVYSVSYSAHPSGRMVMSALDRHFTVTHNDFLNAGPEIKVSVRVESNGGTREFSYLADGTRNYGTRALLEAVGASSAAVIYSLGRQNHYVVKTRPDSSMDAEDAARYFR